MELFSINNINVEKNSVYTFAGWRIVDKNEKHLECVLEKGGDYSWGLHLSLSLITVFWGIVWYLQYKKNKLRRMRISYDNSGNYREERVG